MNTESSIQSKSRAHLRWPSMLATLLLASSVGAQLADPTRPPDYTASPPPEATEAEPATWRLRLVRISGDDRAAVLNDRVVRVGDKLASATVVEIEPGAVVLEQDGARFRVVMSPSIKTQRAMRKTERDPPQRYLTVGSLDHEL